MTKEADVAHDNIYRLDRQVNEEKVNRCNMSGGATENQPFKSEAMGKTEFTNRVNLTNDHNTGGVQVSKIETNKIKLL